MALISNKYNLHMKDGLASMQTALEERRVIDGKLIEIIKLCINGDVLGCASCRDDILKKGICKSGIVGSS
jgi:hypothetical protein